MPENLDVMQKDYGKSVEPLLQAGKSNEVVKYYGTQEARDNTDPVFQFFRNYALAEANVGLGKAKIAGGYHKKAAQFCDKIAEDDPDFASDWDDKITQQRQKIDGLLNAHSATSHSNPSSALPHVTAELSHLNVSSSSSSSASSSGAVSSSTIQTTAPAPIALYITPNS
jgi:hypothetical protein